MIHCNILYIYILYYIIIIDYLFLSNHNGLVSVFMIMNQIFCLYLISFFCLLVFANPSSGFGEVSRWMHALENLCTPMKR